MDDWRQRLRQLMREQGLTDAALERRAGIGQGRMREVFSAKHGPRLDTMVAIANAFGITLTELVEGQTKHGRRVPIIGYVSAGDGWVSFDGDDAVDEIEIVLPAGSAVALEVRGDSMVPVYRDGDVLIGTKRPTRNVHNLLGTDCILETITGERYVKFLMKGTSQGRFNLRSYNVLHEDKENVSVAWAAPISMVVRGGR